MAPRTKARLPTQWIQDENRQITRFAAQEVEDFMFSARNEVEWLNEHMADIFSKSQVNVPEIFKTPGKLRGKTPRTIRKQNPLETRQPLTDVFSTNVSPKKLFSQQKTPAREATTSRGAKGSVSTLISVEIANQINGDVIQSKSPLKQGTPKVFPPILSSPFQKTAPRFKVAKDPALSIPRDNSAGSHNDDNNETPRASAPKSLLPTQFFPAEPAVSQSEILKLHVSKVAAASTSSYGNGKDNEGRKSRSPIKLNASPEAPPLTASEKESSDADELEVVSVSKSLASLEDILSSQGNTPSKKITKSPAASIYRDKQWNNHDNEIEYTNPSNSSSSLNILPTQINSVHKEMLKFEAAGPSRVPVITNNTSIDSGYFGMSQEETCTQTQQTQKDRAEEHAITEGSFHSAEEHMTEHTSVAQTSKEVGPPVDMESDMNVASATEVTFQSAPNPPSPTKQTPNKFFARDKHAKDDDDDDWIQPISASKSKLQSIMKTARSLFTSSAGVSAQAKMETLTPQKPANATKEREQAQGKPDSGSIVNSPSMRTRGQAKGQMEVSSNLNSPHSARTRVQALGQTEIGSNSKSPISTQTYDQAQEPLEAGPLTGNIDMALAQNPAPAQSSQPQQLKPQRRPVKPAKGTASKPKPQPVAIRVGTLSQRIPLSNAALSSTLQDSLAPPQPKQPGLAKKAINASMQAIEKRRLEAARKEQQRQAAQQEKSQAPNRNDFASAPPPSRQPGLIKKASNSAMQTMEKRRLDNAKKEQQRQAAQHEKQQSSSNMNRAEIGGGRPPTRMQTMQDYSRPFPKQPPSASTRAISKRVFEPDSEDENAAPVRIQPTLNPARPPIKRLHEPEVEDGTTRPVRMPGGPSYQQMDQKRRRTEDEELQQTMARPPIRQSSIRKDLSKQSIFGIHQAAQRPSNNYHQPQSMLKTSTLNQAYQQHQLHGQQPRPGPYGEMAKYTNGKIPFAEAPNPPPKSPFRTKQSVAGSARSSPQYVNGENIELEDIPTDSDEESEDEKAKKSKAAMLAEWAQSPELRRILEEQEKNANADEIFGPPASPHMEEMFKERRDRFRNRTSSANWNGSDRLTDEEIRIDRAGRERLRKEGGWFFGL